MENTIFDGECHELCENLAYIAHKCDGSMESIHELTEDQISKYANYLYVNDKEKVIEHLKNIFRRELIHGLTPDDYQIIFRPPWIAGPLAQFGTIVLKFKRSERDNLKGCNAESRNCCCQRKHG